MKRRDVFVHECRVVFVQSREMTATQIQSCRRTQVTTFVNGDSDKLQAVGLRNTSFSNPSSQPGQDQVAS
jgi:hypothetical protein